MEMAAADSPSSSASASATSTGRRRHGGTSGGGCSANDRLGSWLMRKLVKHRKMLITCADSKPAATVCFQYDPLSYSRNFDESGFGTVLDDVDSTHIRHTFSSRFVNMVNSKVSAAPAATANGLSASGCSR